MQKSMTPYTVTELTRKIKFLLEGNFSRVALTGELSNVHKHSSGHTYFTLKDDKSQISGVIWRSRALRIDPEDGIKVVLSGRLSVYEPKGTYQIDVYSMRLLGVGELQILFERLRRKLEMEGLFDAEHKKSIPEYAERIAVITSPSGAVIRDFLNVVRRRNPMTEIILVPTSVQGPGAAPRIAASIRKVNNEDLADVITIARGGGSMEDLQPFNEEIVARSIFSSEIPVVSAIGHEVDFTIADYVADLRAPTPSAAAELIVKDRRVILENLRRNWYTLNESIHMMLSRRRDTIYQLLQTHSFQRPLDLLQQATQRVDDTEKAVAVLIRHKLELSRSVASGLVQRIDALDPRLVLKRGYAIVHRDGHLLTRRASVKKGETVELEFYDGKVTSRVT